MLNCRTNLKCGYGQCGRGAGLAAAIRYVEKIGFDTIMAKEEALTKRAMEGLKKVPHLHILGDEAPENHTGIVAFTIEGVHPHDVSEILSSDGIDVRAGHHCAQPLLEYLGVHNARAQALCFIIRRRKWTHL